MIRVGDICETRTGYKFKVLYIADNGDCFIEWADGGFHGTMPVDNIIRDCISITADRKDEPTVRNNRTVDEPSDDNLSAVEDEPQTDCAWREPNEH